MGPSTDHGSCLSFYHLNTWSVVFCMKIRKLWRQNDVNLAKIRHVFDYNLLTDVVLEHNLQIYSEAQWFHICYVRGPSSIVVLSAICYERGPRGIHRSCSDNLIILWIKYLSISSFPLTEKYLKVIRDILFVLHFDSHICCECSP